MISARNQLPGTVKSVTLGAVMAEVVMDVGGTEVVAAITRHSAESPGSHRGRQGEGRHQGHRGDGAEVGAARRRAPFARAAAPCDARRRAV